MSIKNDLNKFIPRDEQIKALDFIKKSLSDNSNNKFFLMNMPVGIGKSHLAIMIANWYINNINKSAKVDIITAGKILQDQYDNTYESIKNLKGKENYSCSQYACSCAQGKEFNRLNKTKCDECPYDYAKNGFISGNISLTNFHLYLIYAVYGKSILEQRKSNVLIVDECLHPDTEILLYDNTKKKIKDIVEGDLVFTINENTNEVEVKPVIKLHHNLNKGTQMYEIEMENGDVLKITGNHKVKLIDGSWKKAEDLNESDEILYINEINSHEFDNRTKR